MAHRLIVIDDEQNRRDAAALHAAQHLIGGGEYERALATLEPLTNTPSTSIAAQATLLAAALHCMHSRPQQVLELLARVAPVDGVAARGIVVDTGFLLMLRSQALRQLGRLPEAMAAARASCSWGETPARLLVLADCCGCAGDVDGAIAALERACDLDADNVAALAQLAGWSAVAKDRRRSDEAFATFRAKAFADGGDADAWRNAAFAHACRGDIDDAVAAIENAWVAEPDVTRGYVDDEPAFAAFRHTIPCVQRDTR